MIVGTGDLKYELDDSWPRVPEGWSLGTCSDVAVDSLDRVYVFNRDKHPVAVFEADSGQFVTSWGEGEIQEGHGIYIDSEDAVWITDRQQHVVTKHTKYGEKLLELGRRGWAKSVVTPHGTMGGPFNMPAGVCVASDGRIFVADGYGNRQVHRFSATGELELSWGRTGSGAGASSPWSITWASTPRTGCWFATGRTARFNCSTWRASTLRLGATYSTPGEYTFHLRSSYTWRSKGPQQASSQ